MISGIQLQKIFSSCSAMANPSFHSLRSKIRTAKAVLTGSTLAELLAKEATTTRPWPPKDMRTLRSISQASYEAHDFWRIVEVLHRTLRFDRKRWKRAYKALLLADYLLTHGALSFADQLQSEREVIEQMRGFHYVDDQGYDWGSTVKTRAERVLKLLEEAPFLRDERDRLRRATRGIEGFDAFNLTWPLSSTGIEGASESYRKKGNEAAVSDSQIDEDAERGDQLVLLIGNLDSKIRPVEQEAIPLLTCEEGRNIELLSHQWQVTADGWM